MNRAQTQAHVEFDRLLIGNMEDFAYLLRKFMDQLLKDTFSVKANSLTIPIDWSAVSLTSPTRLIVMRPQQTNDMRTISLLKSRKSWCTTSGCESLQPELLFKVADEYVRRVQHHPFLSEVSNLFRHSVVCWLKYDPPHSDTEPIAHEQDDQYSTASSEQDSSSSRKRLKMWIGKHSAE